MLLWSCSLRSARLPAAELRSSTWAASRGVDRGIGGPCLLPDPRRERGSSAPEGRCRQPGTVVRPPPLTPRDTLSPNLAAQCAPDPVRSRSPATSAG